MTTARANQALDTAAPGRADRYVYAAALAIAVCAIALPSVLVLALLAAAFAALVLPAARWLFMVYWALLIGLCGPLSDFPLQAGGIRFYAADAAVYFAFAALFFAVAGRLDGSRPREKDHAEIERYLLALMGALLVWGVLSGVRGVSNGYAVRDVIGDFRRLSFYPCAILLPFALRLRREHLRLIGPGITVACGLVLLAGAYRMATGRSWQEDRYVTTYQYEPHWLSSTEAVTLELSLAYFVATLHERGSIARRALALGLSIASIGMLGLSGWRLGIVMAVAAPMMAIALVTWMARIRIYKFVAMGAALAVTLGAAGATVLYNFPDEAKHLQARFLERAQKDQVRGDARPVIWGAAIGRGWDASPLAGTGFGDQLLVYTRTSGGTFEGQYRTTHNFFIDSLYQSGLIGAALLVSLHAGAIVTFLRRARSAAIERRGLIAALFTGYFASLVTHSLEPFQTAGIVALYTMIGFLLMLLFERTADARQPTAATIEAIG